MNGFIKTFLHGDLLRTGENRKPMDLGCKNNFSMCSVCRMGLSAVLQDNDWHLAESKSSSYV